VLYILIVGRDDPRPTMECIMKRFILEATIALALGTAQSHAESMQDKIRFEALQSCDGRGAIFQNGFLEAKGSWHARKTGNMGGRLRES